MLAVEIRRLFRHGRVYSRRAIIVKSSYPEVLGVNRHRPGLGKHVGPFRNVMGYAQVDDRANAVVDHLLLICNVIW